jgi:alginate O-acetyltransferase complex protein AlgI
MLFNSVAFLLFFPAVVFIYFLLPFRFRWMWLLAASYYFYLNWNPTYGIFIFASTLITYTGARLVSGEKTGRRRKILLAAAIILNLSMLITFKYYNFFTGTITAFLHFIHLSVVFPAFHWLLPVGISFYTFQSLGYLVDVYKGKMEPEKHFGIYALFVSFFPQVASGPVNRAPLLIPQFRQEHEIDYDRVRSGLLQMLLGFFKKLVIADRVAVLVSGVFDHPAEHHGIEIVAAVFFFAVQVYCDFSGYTDIAIGAARIMGIDMMKNFRTPYFSGSITEFWRRWHISLSSWFRDYLYIPLGGNRKGKARTFFNLYIVFVVCGLWHGAAWTYVLFGLLQGTYMVVEKVYQPYQDKLYDRLRWNRQHISFRLYRIAVTFALILFSFIIFRANSISDAILLTGNIFQWDWQALSIQKLSSLGLDPGELYVAFVAIAVLLVIDLLSERRNMERNFSKTNIILRWAFYIAAVLVILIFGYYGTGQKTFIYFQF